MANKKSTLAQRILEYYSSLHFAGKLPKDITMLNPFREDENIPKIATEFYNKFYSDNNKRHLILGINPGRLGSGATGIPFTDTKRLKSFCNIQIPTFESHEPSSVFIYDMVTAFGGPNEFYKKFYINSVCPLGFTITNTKGREVNYNYYDMPELQETVLPFIKWNIQTQIELGCYTDICYCLGTGKNFKFLQQLNAIESYFQEVIPLEHPRYIMQYKLKSKEQYIQQYLDKFKFNAK